MEIYIDQISMAELRAVGFTEPELSDHAATDRVLTLRIPAPAGVQSVECTIGMETGETSRDGRRRAGTRCNRMSVL